MDFVRSVLKFLLALAVLWLIFEMTNHYLGTIAPSPFAAEAYGNTVIISSALILMFWGLLHVAREKETPKETVER
jgi:Na+-transporting NADH:ubiquinone oxidoreductase subunit NqrB